MQPLYLSLEGVFSYKTKQEINFKNLTKAGLFGIFGATGSGKSTILEAIVFALYGDYERMNKQDGRMYNMMNLRSNELHVDYQFSVHTEIYRFTVYARRNKNRFEDITKHERSAYKLQDGEWIPLESVNAEHILGISYENFKRTVIIPQGKFMEFMQLTATDRVRMIKELFNLNKFELYNQTAALDKKNDEEINKLKGRVEQLGDVAIEKVQLLRREYETKHKFLLESEKKIARLRVQKDGLIALKEKFDKVEKLKVQKSAHELQREVVQQKELRLREYEICKSQFHDDILKHTDIEKKQKALQASCTNLQEQITKDTEELSKKEHDLKYLDQELEKHTEYEKKQSDYKQIITIRELIQTLQKEQNRIPEAEKYIISVQHKQKDLNGAIEKALQLKETIQGDINNAIELSKLKSTFTKLNIVKQGIEQAKKEILLADEQIKQKQSDITALLNRFDLKPQSLNSEQVSSCLQTLLLEKKEDAVKMQSGIQQIKLQVELANIAVTLEDGNPCPVCGSIHHPHKKTESVLKDELILHNEAYTKLQTNIELIQDAIGKVQILYTEQSAIRATEKRFSAQMHKDTIERNNLMAELDHIKESDLDKKLETVEKNKKELARLSEVIDSKTKEFKLEEQKENKAKDKLQQIKSDVVRLQAEISTLRSQIRTVSEKEVEAYNDEQLNLFASDLQNKIADQKQRHKHVKAEVDALRKNVASMNGAYIQSTENLRLLTTDLETVAQRLTTLLSSSKYNSIDEVQTILHEHMDVETVRKEIDTFNKELHYLEQTLKELQEELVDKEFDIATFDAFTKEYDSKKHEYDLEYESVIKMNQTLEIQEKVLLEQEKLIQKLESLTERKANIATMKALFYKSGFVHYVSTVYLQNLCTIANERFAKLTRQTLRLELDGDNNFIVRDYVNNGKTRSIKTLSGGQAFQAALSLALALSESVYHTGKEFQEFFFIDEGFGSQDKDSLHTVLETLRLLRKEGKTVGIISHVEDLKEEIGTYISIEKDDELGSVVNY